MLVTNIGYVLALDPSLRLLESVSELCSKEDIDIGLSRETETKERKRKSYKLQCTKWRRWES